MGERISYELAQGFAEVMYFVLNTEYQRGERDLDAMMRRLKDLSAYSLTHAEIMDQSEGVELLALGMVFGMSSNRHFHQNQERLKLLSEETITYQGQAKIIEQEVVLRKTAESRKGKGSDTEPGQPRLL
ncbi:MAG: hypothetical protein MN733_10605 [Nitrososphaera sp.]|nr:hypothetical protein [Nitrososphaera sp.]